MKILQVISSFPPAYAYGGATKVAYDLSRELVKRGHDVTVYTTDVKDSKSRLEIDDNPVWMDGIEVYHFKNLSNNLSHMNFPLAPSMALKLKKELLNFDIVHLHEYRSFHSFLVYHYCKKYGVPYVLQAHGSVKRIIENLELKFLFDSICGFKILENAKGVFAVSKNEIKQYKEMNLDEENIFLVPNPLNINKFTPPIEKGLFKQKLGIDDNLNVILFLGRIHKRKGLNFLMTTFAELVKELNNVVLVIVGPDDNYKENLKKLSKDLNISDKVLFEDYIENVREAYQDADVLVYPAIFEIFGLVPFEAILCNTPVIVTDDCGCGEYVKEANCGFVVEYGDNVGLRKFIKDIFDNPDESKQMVSRGKEFIFKMLAADLIAEKVEKIYEDCLCNL